MRLRNRHSYLATRPEGSPPANPASRVTQFLYFAVLAAVVGYVGWFGVSRYLNFSLRGQVQCERTVVGAARTGTVQGLQARRGDHVQAGQVLARIQPPHACALTAERRGVTALAGEVRVLQARLDGVGEESAGLEAALERSRLRRGLELEVAAEASPERLRQRVARLGAEARVLDARLQAARAELAAARRAPAVAPDCQAQVLRAPAAAVVLSRHLGNGEVARSGDPVLSLMLDGAPVWVAAYLETEERRDVRAGQAVVVELPDGSTSTGQVGSVRSSAADFPVNQWDGYRLEPSELMLQVLPMDTATARKWMNFDRLEVRVRGAR